MTSSPRAPSTWLRRVSAATTPSRPGFARFGGSVVMTCKLWCTSSSVNIDSTINMKETASPWIETAAAVALLGVSRATLYAYVSRGQVRSEPLAGAGRRRGYSREDIERLVARTGETKPGESRRTGIALGHAGSGVGQHAD